MEIEKLSNLLDAQIRSKEVHGSIEDIPICIFRERDRHIGKNSNIKESLYNYRPNLFERFVYLFISKSRK